jgi:hypothetical protein
VQAKAGTRRRQGRRRYSGDVPDSVPLDTGDRLRRPPQGDARGASAGWRLGGAARRGGAPTAQGRRAARGEGKDGGGAWRWRWRG